MIIPTDDDWGNWKDDIDTSSAYKTFAGKKYDEFLDKFKNNPIEMADELRFMPSKPFQYYIFSFENYIRNDKAKKDADAASCFLRLIEEKLINQPEFILPIFDELFEVLIYVADHQDYYDADKDIYGDFQEMILNIKKIKKKLGNSKIMGT